MRDETLSRRRFLLLSAGAIGGAAAYVRGDDVRIERIELFPLRYPMTGYFKFFAGPHGSRGRAAVVVKVTASDGTVGWGQSVPIARWAYETLETATVALRDYFGPAVIGRDPRDIAGAHAAMGDAIAPGFTTGMPISRAGLDIALHDLAAKLQGEPVAALWGREATGPIRLSWTVNVRNLDEVEAVMQSGRDRGYRDFNIKVSPDPSFDVKLARRVRENAPKAFLWADANGGYDTETALDAAPKLADAGVDVLEAPLRPNRLTGYQKLRKQGALPIYMDEGVISPVELREFIRLGMLDGVAMKPARCGGLRSCKRQIDLLLDKGLRWLGSGLTDPDISLAATLQLYGAYDLETPAALNGPQFLTADVLETSMPVSEGQASIPGGPGLGVRVEEKKVRSLVEKTRKDAPERTRALVQHWRIP